MADTDADPKGASSSFFRKVVKFVANPATDWAEIAGNPQEDALQGGYAKSELKAMIERKRRNDFVRKREFDLLRKIRREGLPADGLAGIGGSSELDDSEPRSQGVARTDDAAVKAKIDEIEQQMEGESNARRSQPSQPPAYYAQPTERGGFDETAPPLNEPFDAAPAADNAAANAAPARAKPPPGIVPPVVSEVAWAPTAPYAPATGHSGPGALGLNGAGQSAGTSDPKPAAARPPGPEAASPKPATAGPAMAHRHGGSDFGNPFAVEVNEIAQDPELDEAVISFANADFEACERSITGLIAPGAERADHAETWLVLFDLYRATGQQQAFESLALDYVQRFGWSPPQWFSMPAQVAAEAAHASAPSPSVRIEGSVGWVAPPQLDAEAVNQLGASLLLVPMPWLLDWRPLDSVDVHASQEFAKLLRHWATQKLDMQWVGLDHLLDVLGRLAPTGSRDADPAHWLLRLEVLRVANRPDHFDEVAIDYCVTYEVSPPSWEHSKCHVKVVDSSGITVSSRSIVPEMTSSFPESSTVEDIGGVRTATVELSGQLVGDIGKVLAQLETQLGEAGVVSIHCAHLIRMDFIAAGDLLNWVLQRRSEQRLVHFEDTHRLLGLFFNAMGINEHARVKVRNV